MKKFVILITLLVATITFTFAHPSSAADIPQPTIESPQTAQLPDPFLPILREAFMQASTKEFSTVFGQVPTSAELRCMQENIFFEARGTGDLGMKAVAQVTLNRSKNGKFPHTICGVVHEQKRHGVCQFSWFCNRRLRNGPKFHRQVDTRAWDDSGRIAALALSGTFNGPAPGALYFHATYVHPGWANHMERVGTFGNQVFYRE